MESLGSKLSLPGPVEAWLHYYPPGLRQDAHSHRAPHVSVVVAGSFHEATPGGEWTVCHGGVGFRADDSRHSVRFGPAGALILNVAMTDPTSGWTPRAAPRSGVRWIGSPPRFAGDLLGLARSGRAEAGAEVADRLADLWGTRLRREGPRRANPPAWLRDAAERLLTAPDETPIGALAARIGVHRVHLARQFQLHYGMAPSVFRRRAMASRVLPAALTGKAGLARAAAEAGFADQSHMARTVRDSCAMSIGELRRLILAEVSSVQAGGRTAG